jgi:hypothetical protein
MPATTKTDEELRALWRLFGEGASYEDFPDGATWADLEAAEKLAESEASDAR